MITQSDAFCYSVQRFESVNENLKCDDLNESYRAGLYGSTLFCAVQESPFLGSVDEPLTSMLHKWVLTLKCRNGILKSDRSNEKN